MKREDLFEAVGGINDSFIAAAKRQKKTHKLKIWCTLAACICIVLVGAFIISNAIPKSFESFVNSPAFGASEAALRCTTIQVGNRLAEYNQVSAVPEHLSEYIGDVYTDAGNTTWHYPTGEDSIKYLINANEPSLWIFSHFIVTDHLDEAEKEHHTASYPDLNFSAYTYGELFETVYGIENAGHIVSITASPSTANNTSEGQELQKKVGTHTYTSKEDIEVFYSIVSKTVCYGSTGWRDYEEASYRFTYSFSTDASDKLSSGESTYGSRYLTVTLSDGSTIDSLKYDALKGCFYEFGGIGTKPLNETDVYALNKIFGIK